MGGALKHYFLDSFGLLTIFLGLLVTLVSDGDKLLFVVLSVFRSEYTVIVSNEVFWIIKIYILVITYG